MTYNIKLNSFCLCVKDLSRAVTFYENILGQKAVDEKRGLFIYNGIRICMYEYKKYNDSVVFGDNCLLSFEVDNMESFVNRLKELKIPIVFPITKIGDNYVLEFRDSEGNDVEVYTKCNMTSEKYKFN